MTLVDTSVWIELEHDLEVLHRDRDYRLIARVTGLRQRAV